MKKITLILSFLLFSITTTFAETDYNEILQSIDDLQDFDDMDLSIIWTMVSQKPGEDKSVQKIQIFRRDSEEKALYLMLKPEVDKGSGYLMVDDNAWIYDPGSRKFSFVSLKENIGDSEARNNDIDGDSLVDDYNITATEVGKLGKTDTHIITLEAKTNEVATPKLIIWVRTDKNIILKQEEYSLSDRLVRTTIYPKWTTVGGKFMPSKILFMDNLKEGEKTQISASNISNAQIPDDIFTKDYLERINNK